MEPKELRFSTWAQPVTSRRWALAAVIAHRLCAMSSYRLFSHAKHAAWERACGINDTQATAT